MPPDTGPPPAGGCGRSVIARVISNHVGRMPFRRNAAVMGGIGMSPATAHNIMRRTGACLRKPAGGIAEAVRGADVIHADETSMRPSGANVWVWMFLDPATGSTLFVVRPGRGADAPGEVPGEGWGGTIVRGGWASYKSYRVQGRRARTIREMRHAPGECGCKRCGRAPAALRGIYADACGMSSARVSGARRGRERRRLHGRVRAMIRNYKGLHAVGGFMGRPGRALPNLFRFVLDPSIPPTSNAAERGLREIVVHGKIRGGTRAEKTMEMMCSLFSCVSTWKSRGLDYLQEIARYV